MATTTPRRQWTRTAALAAILCALCPAGAARGDGDAPAPGERRKPNVVVILADDLGWGETGMQGSKDVPTPNIDSIAANGVRFTNAYVSCPVCAPTRAGLQTGRYGPRFGFEFNPGGRQGAASDDFGLPRSETTIAERMKALGYATGMVGKWHLGTREDLRPTARGFDDFYGFLGGGHAYLPAARTGKREAESGILRGDTPVEAPDFLTDAFAREAVAFVLKNKDRPFFLYFPFNAVHAPMQVPDSYLSRFAAIADPKRRTFAAMLSALDDGVGSVLEALRRSNLEEDTLVVFLSDNGGPTPQTTSGNGPLRGTKGTVYEGGIRVPFAMQWKGTIRAGTTYSNPVISLDVLPTAVAAAGGAIPADAHLDGVDLLPFLREGRPDKPHPVLYWRYGGQSAVRLGDWKLVTTPTEGTQLFHLSDDPAESRDLARAEPARAVGLETVLWLWTRDLSPAKWGGKPGRRRKV